MAEAKAATAASRREAEQQALRDHAEALQRGYGSVAKGLPLWIHDRLDDGDDPDGRELQWRVAAILLRDAHVSNPARLLDNETVLAEAAELIARERRRTARHAEAERDRMHAEAEAGGVDVEPEATVGLQPPPFLVEAMPGPLGELVAMWEPWTEAHPASIVLPLLVVLGAHGGEGVRLGQQRCVEYLALVGDSTVARKDTGIAIGAKEFAALVGARPPVLGSPGSGEGIWHRLRDPSEGDAGADDKRLTLLDTEMGGTLAAAHRPGSTIMPTLLSFYDDGTKETLTKNDKVSVTNATFAYVGATVPAQFRKALTLEDRESGFAQRLLVAAVRKVRDVPPSRWASPDIDQQALAALAERVADRMQEAVSRGRIWRLSDRAAAELDRQANGLVELGRPETARAVAHVIRLAMMYCLVVEPDDTDNVPPGVVGLSHLRAALAAWRYCSASADLLYVSSALTDKIVVLTRDAGDDGLSKTELFRATGNHASATEIEDAIRRGVRAGLLRVKAFPTGGRGRPMVRVFAQ